IGEDADGFGAVRGGDAGGHAFGSIDADLKIGAKTFAVLADHPFDAQLLEPFGGGGNADQPAAVFGHEIDGHRRDELGGHDEVAFVFTIGVVDDDDHPSLADVGDYGFDTVKNLVHPEGRG